MKYTNVEKVLSEHINIFIRENYSVQDVHDILLAIAHDNLSKESLVSPLYLLN